MSLGSIVNTGLSAIGGFSQLQQTILDKAPKEMKPLLEAQMKMQKEQETTQLITQMMKQMHEMSTSIIRNIGG